ncbi:pyridoxine 5'-phosphate synthase [Merismopedia glauca]|uniref:Pyridoxine 5'-phosphate synthase n=1 Tax=Merismopedia glauca CCAP 1448/3 TaxID=1296344 RepID=A0A2T1BY74_9CYAN|nr:pyridoxine 5'-phosphate synthase [Merismopedia glauca]PSB00894.1 pyridoxine 5'-phosphate synthase [Merismopedia glauca CCAP 1448/3]
MTNLSVNLNKIALLRNSRHLNLPSVTQAAKTCIQAGAHGITVHPRPDQRHIRFTDVDELAAMMTVEFNIEGNPLHPPFMDIVRRVKPTQCTLVPDEPNTFTSNRGWNITADQEKLVPIIQELQDLGSRVSLFMEPDLEQIQMVPEVGANRIELYTEPYAAAFQAGEVESIFQTYYDAAILAQSLGLGVNAGHDLNLDNLPKFCSIPHILEVSIGHALIADALDMGLFQAVKEYLHVLEDI